MRSNIPVTVIETESFIKQGERVWSEAELDDLKDFVARTPLAGDEMPGTGGLRKLRWSRAGMGKRGGARVIYYYYNESAPLYLLMAYAKATQENPSPAAVTALAKLAESLKAAIKAKRKEKRKMTKKNDKLTDFDKQLIASMEEAVAHACSATNRCRETIIEFADAKAIREGLGMSQSQFSRAFGIPLKTLQHWEQGRHHPDRTASAYLWTIEEFPDQVRKAQQRHQMVPAETEQRPGL